MFSLLNLFTLNFTNNYLVNLYSQAENQPIITEAIRMPQRIRWNNAEENSHKLNRLLLKNQQFL